MDLSQIREAINAFTKTEAFSTLVAGALGAFGGAVGAQIIIARGQEKQRSIDELNNVNSALMLSSSICDTFLGLKKQHVREMASQFYEEIRRFAKYRARQVSKDASTEPFGLRVDLNTLPVLMTPVKALESIVFERIAIGSRGLALMSQLIGALDGVATATRKREHLVEEQRRQQRENGNLVAWYLGVETGTNPNVSDQRFAQNIKAIASQTDDCIFFASSLASELTRYGVRLRTRKRRRLYAGLPKVLKADWSESEGLFPPRELYKSWNENFKKRPGLFARLTAVFRRSQ